MVRNELQPQPLYYMVHYNKILDLTWVIAAPHMVIKYGFCYITTFYSRYNMYWIANTEIGLDPNNSVIKRLWCIANLQASSSLNCLILSWLWVGAWLRIYHTSLYLLGAWSCCFSQDNMFLPYLMIDSVQSD